MIYNNYTIQQLDWWIVKLRNSYLVSVKRVSWTFPLSCILMNKVDTVVRYKLLTPEELVAWVLTGTFTILFDIPLVEGLPLKRMKSHWYPVKRFEPLHASTKNWCLPCGYTPYVLFWTVEWGEGGREKQGSKLVERRLCYFFLCMFFSHLTLFFPIL